jgi:hypothetical protein|tara:strand:- start:2 stop:184 length:183 start_codon:yes stop_codon:yes gene_type:complete
MDNIFNSIQTFNYDKEINYTKLPFCGGTTKRRKYKKQKTLRKNKHIKRKTKHIKRKTKHH